MPNPTPKILAKLSLHLDDRDLKRIHRAINLLPRREFISRSKGVELDLSQLGVSVQIASEAMAHAARSFEEFSRAVEASVFESQALTQPFERRFPNHLPSCQNCQYWSGSLKLPCAVNPIGFNNAGGGSCRDFEPHTEESGN